MPKKPFFTLAFFGWLIFITYSSLSSFSGVDTGSFHIPHADKLVHFVFYFIATVLGVFFLREQVQWNLRPKAAFIAMLIFTVVFGTIIEVIQYHFTTYREGDVFDAIANCLGSFAGVFTMGFLFLRNGSAAWRNKG